MHYLRTLFSAVALALLLATSAHADITPYQATQYVGEQTTVEGLVAQVSRSNGGTTFINFGGRFPDHVFYGVIFRDRAVQFPDVFELEGRTIAISGTIQLYKGKPQIILTSPSQIEVR